MKKIRIKFLQICYRNKEFRAALAFAIYVKCNTTSSTVQAWSVNKLVKLTGMAASTVKKRIAVLHSFDLIFNEGKGGRNLVFRGLKSSCKRNNISLQSIDIITVKEIERGLEALLVAMIQKRKDYARVQLQAAHNGKTLKEVKRAKQKSKQYGWGNEYIEHGLSYSGIAKRLGISVSKAFEVVKYGIGLGIFVKTTHFLKLHAPGCRNLKEVPMGFTFISKHKDNLYKVNANTYQLQTQLI